MSLLKINTYLIVHAVLFLALGFPLYLKPKLTIGLFHNAPDSVKGETLAILSGWGSAIVALGMIAFFLGRSADHLLQAKKYVALGFACGWISFAHGTWVMYNNAYFGNWNHTIILTQLVVQGVLAALSFYFGLLYTERIVPEHGKSH